MTSVLTRMVARGLLAPALVVAAAILVRGYSDVGDGFAAGIIATLAILLQYMAFGRREVSGALPVHRAPVVALAGLAVAVAVFAIPLAVGGVPLEQWPPPGESPLKIGSLELITAVGFDVGVFLLVVGAATAIIDVLAALEDEDAS